MEVPFVVDGADINCQNRSSATSVGAMSAEAKTEVKLEIAHVLFIDTVGYSKLLCMNNGNCWRT